MAVTASANRVQPRNRIVLPNSIPNRKVIFHATSESYTTYWTSKWIRSSFLNVQNRVICVFFQRNHLWCSPQYCRKMYTEHEDYRSWIANNNVNNLLNDWTSYCFRLYILQSQHNDSVRMYVVLDRVILCYHQTFKVFKKNFSNIYFFFLRSSIFKWKKGKWFSLASSDQRF